MLIAIGGVAFAVVLITCEIGMMFGLTRNASILVDRSRAKIHPCIETTPHTTDETTGALKEAHR